MGRGGREKQGSKKKPSRAKGREDIASKQQGSPFRTDYNKLAALIETKGFPSFAVSGEGDKGEAPNMFYPQPPSVISHLNSPFLFTSTLRATTSSPFTSKGKR
ncbi:hypothetical protein AgCh_025078 [Apium graveolens]